MFFGIVLTDFLKYQFGSSTCQEFFKSATVSMMSVLNTFISSIAHKVAFLFLKDFKNDVNFMIKTKISFKFFQKNWASDEWKSTQNSFKNFGHRTKFFVKNQFCWTFRSALTLSSKSLATDVNTILYKLRFFGQHCVNLPTIHESSGTENRFRFPSLLSFASWLTH